MVMVSASEIADAWQQMSGTVERYQIAIQTHYHPGIDELAIEVEETFSRLSMLMRAAHQPGAEL
jgi:hypothetical protein